MNYQHLIDQYYAPDTPLREILLQHSQAVTMRALAIAKAHSELKIDCQFVEEAAMLHDIGIVFCHAPSIHCYGNEPYLCHGHIGAELLRQHNWPRHARVCERHTGAGLTKKDIEQQALPLPQQDFLPETNEEKLICYADKFYSKTHLDREKTLEQVIGSLSKFGPEGVSRFLQWHEMFQ